MTTLGNLFLISRSISRSLLMERVMLW